MRLSAVVALLFAHSVVTDAATSEKQYKLVDANKSVVISSSVSSSLLAKSALSSKFQCLSWCTQTDCAVASFNKTDRVCQLVVINDESAGQAGPDGSHVARNLSSPLDECTMMWTAEDFEQQLQARARKDPVISLAISNSSVGRFGVVQNITISVAGCYRIEAFGAAGATSRGTMGGRGASAAGSFILEASDRLSIVVGQQGIFSAGTNYGTGGGGGSFVYRIGDTRSPQLLIAAGGGGGGLRAVNGKDGSSSTSGTDSNPGGTDYTGTGGVGGLPGLASPNPDQSDPGASCGGPGAGWNGSAVACNYSDPGGPGLSREDGWLGGGRDNPDCPCGDGGFGGGGAGGYCAGQLGAGGGGGGFSGGGASSACSEAGGGGGSFCGGLGCVTVSGANSEPQGRVLLNWTAAACE